MSNPQDSPKTLDELISRLRVFDHSESGSVDFHLNEQECAQLIQSHIDAQKAEVTTDTREVVRGIMTDAYAIGRYGRSRESMITLRSAIDKEAINFATRDQKLVQEAVKPFIAALVWALPHLEDQATNWENEYVYDSPDDTGRLGDAAEYALNKLSATRRLLLNYAVPLAVADIPLETRPFVIVEGDPSDPSRSTVQVIFTDPDALLSQPQEVK